MRDFYDEYAVNPELEQHGKEFDFGGGVKMLIARSHNPTYSRMLKQLYDAHKHTLDDDSTPEAIKEAKRRSNLIMAEVMAHSVLLGWSGPVMYKKAPLPYSVANARKLLELEEFQREVSIKAGDFKNFRFEVEEKDAKNSETTSGGTSPGAESSTSLTS